MPALDHRHFARLALPWPVPNGLLALLVMLPAAMLASYWLGGSNGLFALTMGVPLGGAAARITPMRNRTAGVPRDAVTGLMLRHGFDAVLGQVFDTTRDGALKSACFLIDIDDAAELRTRHGQAVLDDLTQRAADRVIQSLRTTDTIARLGDSRFAVCLGAVRQLDLDLCVQLASRIQSAIENPMRAGGLTLYVTCSVGFCLRSRAPKGDAQAWLTAATAALDDAVLSGPSALRSYTPDLQKRRDQRQTLHGDVLTALENGDIQPWFQPQICAETGRVTGAEALARWVDPDRGLIAPDQFLPALEAQGKLQGLTQVILASALAALRNWDAAGHVVPQVSVNLSQQDLTDPRLCETVSLALARAGLTPDRLCVEILETVVADSPDDTIVRSLSGLQDLGCAIDLDDYGTGHASLAALRRFPVTRIKIDRSFVMKCDRDPDQQKLIGAVMTMAERLDLDTLAEGVETSGERAFLAMLGCHHVQGFGIARPMPGDDMAIWLGQYQPGHAASSSQGHPTG